MQMKWSPQLAYANFIFQLIYKIIKLFAQLIRVITFSRNKLGHLALSN